MTSRPVGQEGHCSLVVCMINHHYSINDSKFIDTIILLNKQFYFNKTLPHDPGSGETNCWVLGFRFCISNAFRMILVYFYGQAELTM